MKNFLVMYMAPARVLEEWAKTDAAVRKPAEDKMRQDWMAWMGMHSAAVVETKAAGKTKRVDAGGVADRGNDIMLYAVVHAETHEAAAEMFVSHPHLGIPEASIEVMEVRDMGGM